MDLPSLERGELPLGVYPASLREVVDRFGHATAKRQALALRLERVYGLGRATGELAHFVVFGSFVTDKMDPNDIDVFL